MRRLFILSFIILFTFAEAQEVRATVSSNSIQLSDVFTFKVEAINYDKNPEVELAPLLNEFSVISGPGQQTSMQWINGKSSSSRSLSWSLIAKEEGQFTIPSLTVKLGKKTAQTNPIVMTVSDSQKDYESNELFLSMEIDKTRAYVGEQITVTYKLFTRVNMSIQNVEFPKHSGFWTEELFVPEQVQFQDVVLEGVNYKAATLYRIALFPTKSGNLELTSMVLNCNVTVKSNNNFFNDPFFGSFGTQTVPKVLRTKQTNIYVSEFPGEIPDGFTGAVGDFRISSSINPQNIKANNAVTLNIELKGTGNIDVLSIPEIQFPQNIEVFPPTIDTKKEPFRDQITGTIIKEYILIPRKTGRYELPQIDITYFNPNVREWRKTSTKEIEISVEPGDNITGVGTGLTKEEVELLGEDIRFIRAEPINWKRDNNPYLLIGIYLLSLLLILLPSLVFKIQEGRLSNEQIRRSKKALKTAKNNLSKKGDDQFTNSSSAIYGFLRDKLLLTSDKLDPLKVKSILEDKIEDGNIINDTVDLLKICDAGRFAPGGDVSREKLVKRTKTLLKQLNAKL